MKRVYAALDGYYSKSDLEKICELMQGKSYMDFDVHISPFNGGWSLGVSTTCEGVTPEELKRFFTYCIVTELAHRL